MLRWQYERLIEVVRPDATRWVKQQQLQQQQQRLPARCSWVCCRASAALSKCGALEGPAGQPGIHCRPPCPPLPPPSWERSIAAIVEQHGLGDGQQWMANWEAAWAANLAACGPGPDGECSVR